MKISTTFPRQNRTQQNLPALILEELVHIFQRSVAEGHRDVFMEKIYQPTLQHCRKNQGGDFMVHYWKSQNAGKLGLAHLIQISCAFCIQAAAVRGQSILVWAYLMDAQLYLGMAKAGMASRVQVEEMQRYIAKDALIGNAKSSAAVGADPWRKTRAEAERRIRVLADGGKRWSSRVEAAREVAEHVQAYLAKVAPHKRFQDEKRRDEKIANWLGKMPEAPLWFAPERKVNGR